MFEPVRGGTRGGQAEFKWADVSADKDREASAVLACGFGCWLTLGAELSGAQRQCADGALAEEQGYSLV